MVVAAHDDPFDVSEDCPSDSEETSNDDVWNFGRQSIIIRTRTIQTENKVRYLYLEVLRLIFTNSRPLIFKDREATFGCIIPKFDI